MARIAAGLLICAGVACAGLAWWPAAVLLAPPAAWLLLSRIFAPAPQWGRLEEVRTGSARWTPRGADAHWLDGAWDARVGRGAWHEVKMPADLATLPGFARSGPLWFRRRFQTAPEFRGKRVFLGFLGIGGVAEVFVDGRRQAGPSYGFCPFEIELAPEINDGAEHEILLRVTRSGLRVTREMALGPPYAAGLFRDVYLQARPRIFIESAHLLAGAPGRGPSLVVRVNGRENHPVAISGAIKDDEKQTAFSFQEFLPGVDGAAELAIEIPADRVKPWSRFAPRLYTVQASLVCADAADSGEWSAGYKEFSITPQGIEINGKAERLYGARRAEHFPPYGGAFPGWAMKRDAELFKEALLNVAVNAHFPLHPAFVEVCDREGLYICEELPIGDIWRGDADRGLDALGRAMRAAEARPCFLFWFTDFPVERIPRHARERVAALLREAHERGRLVVSPRAARALGLDTERAQLRTAVMDIYGDADEAEYFHAPDRELAVIAALDMVDGRGGADSRHAREMRKAEADQLVLKAADKARAAMVVLGHLCGWGLRLGLISVTRKKKVSLDVVREYLRNRTTGGLNVPEPPAALIAKASPLALLVVLALIVLLQPVGIFLMSWPGLCLAFVPDRILLLIKALSFLVCVLSVAMALEGQPRHVFRLAGALRFPVFLRVASRWQYRALGVGLALAWCQAAGLGLIAAMAPGSAADAARALAVASVADAAFAALLFVRCPLGPFAAAVALCHAALLAAMIPWPLATVFTAMAYGPAVLYFAAAPREDAWS